VFCVTESSLHEICGHRALRRGHARTSDAISFARDLNGDDVAFLDPPYSGVHYSRFYHVLETVARGQCAEVTGDGRYPPPQERPTSSFSRPSESREALNNLFSVLAERRVRTILTFPTEKTSNGLSGQIVQELAKKYFKVRNYLVNGRFSTLGGNKVHRAARIPAYEVILVMQPR